MYKMARISNDFYPRGIDYTAGDLKKMFKEHFYRISKVYLTETKIRDIEIIGSRVWKLPKPSSDLDILVRYEGNANPQDLKSVRSMIY